MQEGVFLAKARIFTTETSFARGKKGLNCPTGLDLKLVKRALKRTPHPLKLIMSLGAPPALGFLPGPLRQL